MRESSTEEGKENQRRTKGVDRIKHMRRGKLQAVPVAVPHRHHLARIQAQLMVPPMMKRQW